MTGSREIWEVHRYFDFEIEVREEAMEGKRTDVTEVQDTVWLRLGSCPLGSCSGVDGTIRYDGTQQRKEGLEHRSGSVQR